MDTNLLVDDASNEPGGSFWFWNGFNPRAVLAWGVGAAFPAAEFASACVIGGALVAPGLALARGATLGAAVSSAMYLAFNKLAPPSRAARAQARRAGIEKRDDELLPALREWCVWRLYALQCRAPTEASLSGTDVDRLVEDLFEDLKDGRVLKAFVEELSGTTIPGKQTSGNTIIQHVANLTPTFAFIKSTTKIVGIGPQDVADGNPGLVLGLLWSLIVFFASRDLGANQTKDLKKTLLESGKGKIRGWDWHPSGNGAYKFEGEVAYDSSRELASNIVLAPSAHGAIGKEEMFHRSGVCEACVTYHGREHFMGQFTKPSLGHLLKIGGGSADDVCSHR